MKNLMLAFILISSFAVAEAEFSASTDESHSAFELGFSTGFPTLAAIQLGYWGPRATPFLIRTALGVGSTLDLGFYLPVKGTADQKVYLALTGGSFGYLELLNDPLVSSGLTIGYRIRSFFAQAGPMIYHETGDDDFVMAAHAQFGLSLQY